MGIMRKMIQKRFVASVLSFILALSLFGCGKKEVSVDDYGSTEADSIGTEGDAFQQGEGQTLGQLFGTVVKWEDTFAIQGVNTKADISIKVPEEDYLNVYKVKSVPDGLDDEERIVSKIFGDSAEKLEEIKYTNETDYITLLYKYRELTHIFQGDQYNYFMDADSYEQIMGSIDSGFSETYKWEDNSNYYIHMYEGKYNGIRYGLILAYDYGSGIRYIFLDPISIKEYFPNSDYKTMLYEENFDTTKKVKELENECNMSVDEAKKKASDFIADVVGLNDTDNIIDTKPDYYHNLVGLSLYPSIHNDGGPMVLTFSDADYVSSVQNGTCGGETLGLSRVAAQIDLVVENLTESNSEQYTDYYTFLRQYNSAGTVTPNLTRNGYALYLQSETATAMMSGDMFYMSEGNTGVIKLTDKGIYGVDLVLYNETIDIVENVRLLDFEKIKESARNALEEKLDLKKLGDPKELTIGNGFMMYEPCYDDKEDSEEYTYIPVWKFHINGDDIGTGEDGYLNVVELSINAMDGSVNQFYQYGDDGSIVRSDDSSGSQTMFVEDESDEEE